MRLCAKGDQYAQPVIASAASRDIQLIIVADGLDHAVKIALTAYPPPPPKLRKDRTTINITSFFIILLPF